MNRKIRQGFCVTLILSGVLVCSLIRRTHGSDEAAAATKSKVSDSQESSAALALGEVDLRRSRVYVFVGKTGLGHDHGVEGRLKSGTVRLDAGESAGELVFDMNSFDADTDAARKYVGLSGSTDTSTRQQVNTNMKGAPILNVRQFPTATFKIDSCRQLERKNAKGQTAYELSGKFTLRGVTRPLKFSAEYVEDKGIHRLRGNFSILQTNYGITPFKKAFGAVGVANQLKIFGDLVIGGEPQ